MPLTVVVAWSLDVASVNWWPGFCAMLGPLPSRGVAAVAALMSRYVWYKLLWE